MQKWGRALLQEVLVDVCPIRAMLTWKALLSCRRQVQKTDWSVRAGSALLQEVLVDELVAAVDTLQRYALSGAVQRVLGSLPAALASNAVRALGPWRPLLLPIPTPLELLNR